MSLTPRPPLKSDHLMPLPLGHCPSPGLDRAPPAPTTTPAKIPPNSPSLLLNVEIPQQPSLSKQPPSRLPTSFSLSPPYTTSFTLLRPPSSPEPDQCPLANADHDRALASLPLRSLASLPLPSPLHQTVPVHLPRGQPSPRSPSLPAQPPTPLPASDLHAPTPLIPVATPSDLTPQSPDSPAEPKQPPLSS